MDETGNQRNQTRVTNPGKIQGTGIRLGSERHKGQHLVPQGNNHRVAARRRGGIYRRNGSQRNFLCVFDTLGSVVTISTPHAHAANASHHFFHDLDRCRTAVPTAIGERVHASVVGLQVRGFVVRSNAHHVCVYAAQSISHGSFYWGSREARLRDGKCSMGRP